MSRVALIVNNYSSDELKALERKDKKFQQVFPLKLVVKCL